MAAQEGPVELSDELLHEITKKMLRMTNRDTDHHMPSYEGIAMVLRAMHAMPELKVSWVDPYGPQALLLQAPK